MGQGHPQTPVVLSAAGRHAVLVACLCVWEGGPSALVEQEASGHIARFSMTPHSPSKLGSLPQQVRSSNHRRPCRLACRRVECAVRAVQGHPKKRGGGSGVY